MKIVKITEPREGFVYENDEGVSFVLYRKEDDEMWSVSEYHAGKFKHNRFLAVLEEAEVSGALNITHTIEDNKLVEIKRRDIEVGDVYEKDTGRYLICTKLGSNAKKHYFLQDNGTMRSEWIGCCRYKKIGTMSVTHELDWSIT